MTFDWLMTVLKSRSWLDCRRSARSLLAALCFLAILLANLIRTCYLERDSGPPRVTAV